MSPAISSSTIPQAGISSGDEVHSSLAAASLRAVAIETGVHPLGVDPSCDAPADSRGPALGHANGAVLFTVEVPTSPPLSSVAPVLGSEDESDIHLQVVDLRNGSALAHVNGHARDHANGHNGGSRRRDEFDLGEVATFLSGPLVSTGFAGNPTAPSAMPLRHTTAPAIPTLPTGLYARMGKRALDFAGGILAFVLAGPVILLAALAVKLSSRGPAFYKSTRLGKDGRPFTFLKLRSMYVGADAERARLMHLNEVDGPVFKLRRDPRVTRVGQWLRSTSVDELPQLLNVLKGDMSLVGPRPPLPEEADRYGAWQRRRLDVKPGITCLWQVSGRSRLSFDEWMRLDLEYIRRQSLATDLWILVRTIPAVLSREGAY